MRQVRTPAFKSHPFANDAVGALQCLLHDVTKYGRTVQIVNTSVLNIVSPCKCNSILGAAYSVLVALNATKAFYQLSGNGALSAGVGSNDKNTSLSHIRVIFVKFRLCRIELFRADSLSISNVSPT